LFCNYRPAELDLWMLNLPSQHLNLLCRTTRSHNQMLSAIGKRILLHGLRRSKSTHHGLAKSIRAMKRS
jgi:hypothetical protein